MKHEYREGPEATEHFKRIASALFQVPKNKRKTLAKKKQPKKATSRRSTADRS